MVTPRRIPAPGSRWPRRRRSPRSAPATGSLDLKLSAALSRSVVTEPMSSGGVCLSRSRKSAVEAPYAATAGDQELIAGLALDVSGLAEPIELVGSGDSLQGTRDE